MAENLNTRIGASLSDNSGSPSLPAATSTRRITPSDALSLDVLLSDTGTTGRVHEFAKYVSQSELVPRAYKGRPQDVFMGLVYARQLGVPAPLLALANIANIHGTPTLFGNLPLALVKQHPQYAGMTQKFVGKPDSDEWTAVVTMRRAISRDDGEYDEVEQTFSVADAKRAGVWGRRTKSGEPTPWTTHPQRMLMRRARSYAIQDLFPDVITGCLLDVDRDDDGGGSEDGAPSVLVASVVRSGGELPEEKVVATVDVQDLEVEDIIDEPEKKPNRTTVTRPKAAATTAAATAKATPAGGRAEAAKAAKEIDKGVTPPGYRYVARPSSDPAHPLLVEAKKLAMTSGVTLYHGPSNRPPKAAQPGEVWISDRAPRSIFVLDERGQSEDVYSALPAKMVAPDDDDEPEEDAENLGIDGIEATIPDTDDVPALTEDENDNSTEDGNGQEGEAAYMTVGSQFPDPNQNEMADGDVHVLIDGNDLSVHRWTNGVFADIVTHPSLSSDAQATMITELNTAVREAGKAFPMDKALETARRLSGRRRVTSLALLDVDALAKLASEMKRAGLLP